MEVISTLPAMQRQSVLYYYYDGMSINEIAESMDLAYTSVHTHLTRAREAIGEKLKKHPYSIVSTKTSTAAFGALLFESFNESIVNFNIHDATWISSTVALCQEALSSGTAAASEIASEMEGILAVTASATVIKASGITSTVVTITCATAVAACAIGAGVWLASSEPPEPPPVVIETQIEGKVLFTGGYDYGDNTVYVNPEHAEPQAESTGGEVTVINWWILRQGSEEILYSGDGDTVDDTLIFLKENGYRGEYLLYFRLECGSGAIQRIGSNFYIRD